MSTTPDHDPDASTPTPDTTTSPGASGGSGDVAGQLVALARDVERIGRRQGGLADELAQLDGLLRRMAEDVTLLAQGAETDTPDTALRSWLLPDHGDGDEVAVVRAVAALDDLAQWLGAVYLRFPGAVLSSCWAWHPAAVEELRWLREAHQDAFEGPRASWREVGDWHDRQRPGVVRRVAAELRDCDLSQHQDTGPGPTPTVVVAGPVVPLTTHLAAVAAAWALGRGAPVPDPAQLAEAADHDRTQLRRRHR